MFISTLLFAFLLSGPQSKINWMLCGHFAANSNRKENSFPHLFQLNMTQNLRLWSRQSFPFTRNIQGKLDYVSICLKDQSIILFPVSIDKRKINNIWNPGKYFLACKGGKSYSPILLLKLVKSSILCIKVTQTDVW